MRQWFILYRKLSLAETGKLVTLATVYFPRACCKVRIGNQVKFVEPIRVTRVGAKPDQ